MEYRLHLLADDRSVLAIGCFSADNQTDALRIASTIFDSCRDAISGCELWSGAEPIGTEYHPLVRRRVRITDLTETQQELVREREIILREAYELIRESKLLLGGLSFVDAIRQGKAGEPERTDE